ncbi:MAG: hypothetical protein UU08_C0029G0002 [Candidatus Uhrbacteria bacterium GW2011_GWE2_40_58]|nr:MAG: hypothetical protein UT94_C0039G0002 [Candidatus Uhrbacteria bacterium GW2011_GWF2_40_263]KKR67000.1 MAG: hypothetical protein UU08_C0029G0002 [Candidatus Uhrbacteria bacterium GW2011_GWE2_40_58]
MVNPEFPHELSFTELKEQFSALKEQTKFAHQFADKIASQGEEGIDFLLSQFEEANDLIKNQAYFRFVELAYTKANNLEKALKIMTMIPNKQEQLRCQVRLANEIIQREGDYAKAEAIIDDSIEDIHGYRQYLNNEK